MTQQQTFGDFGFQSDPLQPTPLDLPSIRELFEAVAVAIILAMIFKTLQAEPYIIPTGSMAPNLMGQHMDVYCEDCGHRFQAGTDRSESNGSGAVLTSDVACPMCHKVQMTNRKALKQKYLQSFKDSDYDSNRESFAGDRIIVNKLHYLFEDPIRWDVIVFKYPGSAKQNYIKRLVGLPDETVLLVGGDVYAAKNKVLAEDPSKLTRSNTITRKSPSKLLAMMIPVADSHFFSKKLRSVGWPSKWFKRQIQKSSTPGPWANFCSDENQFTLKESKDQPVTFELNGAGDASGEKFHWVRFKNMIPNKTIWQQAEEGKSIENILPEPSAVTDNYGYNDYRPMPLAYDSLNDKTKSSIDGQKESLYSPYGFFWVGDLIQESEIDIQSVEGKLAFDLVEGGVHFLCQLDLVTGKGTMQSISSVANTSCKFQSEDGTFGQAKIEFSFPKVSTGVQRFRFSNCDDQLTLWINDQVVDLPGKGIYQRTGTCTPTYTQQDPGDLHPVGIGGLGAKFKINRMKVFRDLYYFQPNQQDDTELMGFGSFFASKNLWNTPLHWSMASSLFPLNLTNTKNPLNWSEGYRLEPDQYFPLGDNGPISEDARRWPAPRYVQKEFMIGKAFLVYWPHTWNNPPFFPNFSKIRWIR